MATDNNRISVNIGTFEVKLERGIHFLEAGKVVTGEISKVKFSLTKSGTGVNVFIAIDKTYTKIYLNEYFTEGALKAIFGSDEAAKGKYIEKLSKLSSNEKLEALGTDLLDKKVTIEAYTSNNFTNYRFR